MIGELRPYTDIQEYSEEERLAARLLFEEGYSLRDLLFFSKMRSSAANDNDSNRAADIALDDQLMQMVYCWLQCDRDELLAKLTYVPGRKYDNKHE